MQVAEWDKVHDFVEIAARVLFTSMGVPVTYIGTVSHQSADWKGRLAIIGLGGGKLRGSLVLNVPDTLLKASHPLRAGADEDLADWLAELANLMLGQIKRDLMACGVVIELSTPVTVSATDFRFVRLASTPVVHMFSVGGGVAHVVFDSVSEPSVALMPPREEPTVEAGEVVLF